MPLLLLLLLPWLPLPLPALRLLPGRLLLGRRRCTSRAAPGVRLLRSRAAGAATASAAAASAAAAEAAEAAAAAAAAAASFQPWFALPCAGTESRLCPPPRRPRALPPLLRPRQRMRPSREWTRGRRRQWKRRR